MNFAIFFAGSGQEAKDTKLVYHDWATQLAQSGYAPLLCDGVDPQWRLRTRERVELLQHSTIIHGVQCHHTTTRLTLIQQH